MNALGQRRLSVGLVVVAVLALAQGVLRAVRTAEWIQIGRDLSQRGFLLLPIIGDLAFVLAAVVAIIAALYGLFAWGALTRRGWAWSLGLAVVLLDLFAVGFALLAAESLGRPLLWAIVPVILAGYLLAPAGRRAIGITR
ncbi:MAG: hypothetical protein ACRD3A_09905 [Terriglobales bacterium]